MSDSDISASELAEMLGVSRMTVNNMIRDGRIKAKKVGKSYVISMDSIESLDSHVSDEEKEEIKKAIKKAVDDYGETFKLLAKE